MHILLPTSPLQYAQQRLPLPHRHPPYSRTKTHHTHLIAHEIASAPSAPWATRSSPRSLFHQTVAFLCRPAARRWLNPHGPTTCERRARGNGTPSTAPSVCLTPACTRATAGRSSDSLLLPPLFFVRRRRCCRPEDSMHALRRAFRSRGRSRTTQRNALPDRGSHRLSDY